MPHPACSPALPADLPLSPEGWPLVDLHVHPDNSTLAAITALSQERGVVFGMVEHAGTKENVYPRVLSTDAELLDWTTALAGQGVFKGVQAEWTDWAVGFSTQALGTLDYVLTDTMTFPGPDGRRMKLWEKEAVLDANPERFMDHYVDWHLQILEQSPLDVLANVSWIPTPFAERYKALWTEARMAKVIEAFVRHGIAMEISAGFQLPRLRFLREAKAAGVRFCFGSNGRYPAMGKLDYALQCARDLELTAAHLWLPEGNGPRGARRA